MSTTIYLHVRTEEMSYDDLQGLGVIGGPLGQLAHDIDIDRERRLLTDSPSYSVGESAEEFPSKVVELVTGPTEIDETVIEMLTTVALQTDVPESDIEELREFLAEHEGREMFTMGW